MKQKYISNSMTISRKFLFTKLTAAFQLFQFIYFNSIFLSTQPDHLLKHSQYQQIILWERFKKSSSVLSSQLIRNRDSNINFTDQCFRPIFQQKKIRFKPATVYMLLLYTFWGFLFADLLSCDNQFEWKQCASLQKWLLVV